MDELSAGQASTLARNEAVIDKSMEELEELEEALCESIAESIRGRRSAAEKLPGAKKKKRCVWGFGPRVTGSSHMQIVIVCQACS